jgi:QueF-like protein
VPKTGLPDFGAVTVRSMPRERCLELKSLKEYLFTYRNLGIFQENVFNQVLEDVVKACHPGPWSRESSVLAASFRLPLSQLAPISSTGPKPYWPERYAGPIG